MPNHSVRLRYAASEMAKEEIRKQVAFLSRSIANVGFSEDGVSITYDAAPDQAAALGTSVQDLGNRIARALQSLERKIVFSSAAMANPKFAADASMDGVHFLGTGQVALSGIPLRLFNYFDRVFEDFGRPWQAEPLRTPTLIPSKTLSRCDYFRSFPHNVTFASHLREDAQVIDGFRARHQTVEDLDSSALADMERPEACLSPAVCYHVYHLHENQTLPAAGINYGICGKCFRYESSNLRDLRRLWDFTMREVVFLGGRDDVLQKRERSIGMMSTFIETHQLAGEIRTASDPFFVAPDAVSKTYFQLSSDSKLEVSLLLPDGERSAVGSHNYHSDFFGRAFQTEIAGAGPMHSVCVAFGLERWVYAFLKQHGAEPAAWPEIMRQAPEFRT
ncbi:MAG TPA: aminoacyl--tRNA ligase-related protein [Bryobacteraceae bacterium]|nr:aminoacyl--tRNA ligase-related protein [Bryobacteraceae bacterium]